MKQRHRMGRGEGPIGGVDFGVDPFPVANKTGGKAHGSHMSNDGATLSDSQRAGPPGIRTGSGSMNATAHSHHGPH